MMRSPSFMSISLLLISLFLKGGRSFQVKMINRKPTLVSMCTDDNDAGQIVCDRRQAITVSAATSLLLSTATAVTTGLFPSAAYARTPGSTDVTEAVMQIQDAANDLRKLKRDWSQYTVIDAEGRAGSTDGARRILGGIAPQAGSTAIEVAKATPLYRIDNAFAAVRKEALKDESSWASSLDLPAFEEAVERIIYLLQKTDGDFYSVLFAAKGTTQIEGIYSEARRQVDEGILDFDQILLLLKDAGAPGL